MIAYVFAQDETARKVKVGGRLPSAGADGDADRLWQRLRRHLERGAIFQCVVYQSAPDALPVAYYYGQCGGRIGRWLMPVRPDGAERIERDIAKRYAMISAGTARDARPDWHALLADCDLAAVSALIAERYGIDVELHRMTDAVAYLACETLRSLFEPHPAGEYVDDLDLAQLHG